MYIKRWARIPWPCIITATRRRRNPSNQQQHSFQWNPHSHRLKTSRQGRITAIKVPVWKSGAYMNAWSISSLITHIISFSVKCFWNSWDQLYWKLFRNKSQSIKNITTLQDQWTFHRKHCPQPPPSLRPLIQACQTAMNTSHFSSHQPLYFRKVSNRNYSNLEDGCHNKYNQQVIQFF